jgi:hypothetical protein
VFFLFACAAPAVLSAGAEAGKAYCSMYTCTQTACPHMFFPVCLCSPSCAKCWSRSRQGLLLHVHLYTNCVHSHVFSCWLCSPSCTKCWSRSRLLWPLAPCLAQTTCTSCQASSRRRAGASCPRCLAGESGVVTDRHACVRRARPAGSVRCGAVLVRLACVRHARPAGEERRGQCVLFVCVRACVCICVCVCAS